MKTQAFLFVFAIIISFTSIIGFCNSAANAQNIPNNRFLILTDDYSEHYLSPYLYEYKAQENSDINSVIHAPHTPIIKNETPHKIIKLSNHKDATWLGFDVQNKSTKTKWAINLGTTNDGQFGLFNELDIFVKQENSNQFVKSDTTISNGLFPLSINNVGKAKVLIKLKSSGSLPAMIPFKMVDFDNINSKNNYKSIIFILFILIGLACFFAAIAYVQTEFGYFYFSIYYILLSFILSIQNNFLSLHDFVTGKMMVLLYFSVALTTLFMTKFFWGISNENKIIRLSLTVVAFLGFISVLNGLYFINSDSFLKSLFIYLPLLAIFITNIIITIYFLQNYEDRKNSFLYALLISLLGFVISTLPFIGVMQPISTALNAYWYAILPQAFFFIVAIKEKILLQSHDVVSSKYMQINETDSVSRFRESREGKEQERLLRVIEQERKVLENLKQREAKRTDEMRKAKDIADQANKAKSAFLAVVTHEIRTPMTGIMGMVRLLMESNLSKDQKTYAQTIQDSSDAMLALLNDILDFEKIEQGKMTFETITFDLHRVLNGVAVLMNGHAVQKNIEMRIKLGDNVPQFVKGDPTRLRQVLLNLTGNAVKFTETGHVTISVERIENEDQDKNENCEIYFSVIDSGIGISKEVQTNLFTPFSQANNTISRKFGGTGLGLAISKGLVQAMGSEININSNEGEGSTFFFILKMPIGKSDQNSTNNIQKPKDTIDNVTEKAILVVDDNEINLNVVQGLLAKLPHKITSVNSAEKSIEITKEKQFDLILMDIELPNMKGDEAAIKIRDSHDSLNKETPIIALTGNLMPHDIERYKQAHMNDVLEKPIDPEKLMHFVNRDYKKEAPLETVKNTTHEAKEKLDSSDINAEVLDMLKSHLKHSDIEDMLNDVIIKSNEIVNSIKKHFEDKDFQKIMDRCHELRGMTGNFGLTDLSQFAHVIERNIKNDDVTTLEKDLKILEEKEKRAARALQIWLKNNF